VSNTGPIACTILTIEATVSNGQMARLLVVWRTGQAKYECFSFQYDGTHYNILSVIGPTVWQAEHSNWSPSGKQIPALQTRLVVASLSPATTSITVGASSSRSRSQALQNSSTMTLAVMGNFGGLLQWADGSALAPNDWPCFRAQHSSRGTERFYSLHFGLWGLRSSLVSHLRQVGYSGLLIQNYFGPLRTRLSRLRRIP